MKVVVAGGPGTGKTYTVITCLDYIAIGQLRMAPTARVAQKINGRTIHSAMRLKWGPGSVLENLVKKLATQEDPEECMKQSAEILDEFRCGQVPDIIVIDEVGMVAFWLIEWIFQYFFQNPTPKLCIVMGDPNQLRPVKSIHNIFSVGPKAEMKRIDLTESKRFVPEYEEIIERLRMFVDCNDETGLLTFLYEHFPVVESIDADILRKCTRALAHRNETVDKYNEFYLEHLIPKTKEFNYGRRLRLLRRDKNEQKKVYVDVKCGCRIFCTQNGVSSVSNGTPLIFKNYIAEEDRLECLDPATNDLVRISRNRQGDFPIVVGFAGTIHKFQGDTMDDAAIAINFNGSRDLNLIYTALSRVRCMSQIVAIQLDNE